MKRMILVSLLLVFCIAGNAQEKTRRQERMDRWKNDMKEFRIRSESDRKEEAITDTLLWYRAGEALAKSTFVLEADAVTFKDGRRVMVNRTLNFISVNGKRGVVQISPSTMYSGPNGVGGITLDGNISGLESSTDRKGNVRITMNVMGVGINARIDITLYSGSDDAYAVVTPNFSSRTVRVEGKIVPFGMSKVVEGMSM